MREVGSPGSQKVGSPSPKVGSPGEGRGLRGRLGVTKGLRARLGVTKGIGSEVGSRETGKAESRALKFGRKGEVGSEGWREWNREGGECLG